MSDLKVRLDFSYHHARSSHSDTCNLWQIGGRIQIFTVFLHCDVKNPDMLLNQRGLKSLVFLMRCKYFCTIFDSSITLHTYGKTFALDFWYSTQLFTSTKYETKVLPCVMISELYFTQAVYFVHFCYVK